MALLVACQPLPHPFADDVPRKGSAILALRDSASVTIAPIKGTPRATAEKLGPAMAAALQAKNAGYDKISAQVTSRPTRQKAANRIR